jgi:pimeloyl-ACP methyl ester carboxylesterase
VSDHKRVLFLHGGPGLSAALERQRFGSALPVHWWDQPHATADAAAPFERLLDAAEKELSRLFQEQGRPVALLANSFGVHLALGLSERAPQKIGPLHILGGTLDMRAAFVRLGLRISEVNHDSELEAVSARAQDKSGSESLWALIQKLFTVSNLLDFYWSANAQAQLAAMKALAASGSLVDVPTYLAVLRDFLDSRPVALPTFSGAAVRVLIGCVDPYARSDDADRWQAVFPNASVEFVKAGHFPHLELPAEDWMPAI